MHNPKLPNMQTVMLPTVSRELQLVGYQVMRLRVMTSPP